MWHGKIPDRPSQKPMGFVARSIPDRPSQKAMGFVVRSNPQQTLSKTYGLCGKVKSLIRPSQKAIDINLWDMWPGKIPDSPSQKAMGFVVRSNP
jgi:hypothetical protein